jgi:hypothetical protein
MRDTLTEWFVYPTFKDEVVVLREWVSQSPVLCMAITCLPETTYKYFLHSYVLTPTLRNDSFFPHTLSLRNHVTLTTKSCPPQQRCETKLLSTCLQRSHKAGPTQATPTPTKHRKACFPHAGPHAFSTMHCTLLQRNLRMLPQEHP